MKRRRSFLRDPRSVSAARRFAMESLRIGTDAEVRDAVELMVSELATNCVRHTNTAFDLTVDQSEEEIRVEVTDWAGGRPTMHSPGPDEPTGRGLRIVNVLSDAWGVEHRAAAGKTVWFTVALAASSLAR
jgi:serine/threonine-protein kinase RsbW